MDDQMSSQNKQSMPLSPFPMNEQDNTFSERFTRNLGIMYKEMRDMGEVSHIGALEVLRWTGD
jgi:hypothetical protein